MEMIGFGTPLVIATAAGALAVPSLPGDGVPVPATMPKQSGVLKIRASGGPVNVTNAIVYGYITADTLWYEIDFINAKGSTPGAFSVTLTKGYVDRFVDLGLFDRLAVSAALDANALDVVYVPVPKWDA